MLGITTIVLSEMKVIFENCSTIRQVHLTTRLFVPDIKPIESVLAARPNTQANRHAKEQMNKKENITLSGGSLLCHKTNNKRYVTLHTHRIVHIQRTIPNR